MANQPDDIAAIAALDEPVRRNLYDWVVAAGRPVSRDEAAGAVGVSRALAAFHLDRLVRDKLLVPEYRRLSGRTGPGAGRPAKLYRRGPREVAVSLPERRYETVARLLAATIERISGDGPPPALEAAARAVGETEGAEALKQVGRRPSRARRRDALIGALRRLGYEPRAASSGEIRLGNCPYHALVEDHRPLVCGMNLALAQGLLAGVAEDGVVARLDPQPGLCCVAVAPRE
jgi:predicted ArsR family transcriptional regulator